MGCQERNVPSCVVDSVFFRNTLNSLSDRAVVALSWKAALIDPLNEITWCCCCFESQQGCSNSFFISSSGNCNDWHNC